MLPEMLSNGLCSLVPGEDWLTHVAIMDFNSKGEMKSVRLVKLLNKLDVSPIKSLDPLKKPDNNNPSVKD